MTKSAIITGAFHKEEKLREGAGNGAIVVVDIADIVRVELELVVVEVPVRRVVEANLGIRILSLPIRITRV